MKRSKKILRNHFLRRLKVEREKHIEELSYKQYEINALKDSLEKASKLNLTLNTENSILKKRIRDLKTKRWYQFIAVQK